MMETRQLRSLAVVGFLFGDSYRYRWRQRRPIASRLARVVRETYINGALDDDADQLSRLRALEASKKTAELHARRSDVFVHRRAGRPSSCDGKSS